MIYTFVSYKWQAFYIMLLKRKIKKKEFICHFEKKKQQQKRRVFILFKIVFVLYLSTNYLSHVTNWLQLFAKTYQDWWDILKSIYHRVLNWKFNENFISPSHRNIYQNGKTSKFPFSIFSKTHTPLPIFSYYSLSPMRRVIYTVALDVILFFDSIQTYIVNMIEY